MANYFNIGQALSDAESIKGQRTRNAFADSELRRERRLNALADDPNATPNQYSRLGRSDIGNALLNNEQAKRQALAELGVVAQRALQAPDPQTRRAIATAAMQEFAPQFQALGAGAPGNIDQVSDEDLAMALQKFAAFAPQGQQRPDADFSLSPGQSRFDAGGRQIASVAPTPEKPKAQFRPMSPEEIAGAGLPPGTSAQVNDDTGQISVLSKRDSTASLSQKDQNTAKQKLNIVKVARAQLQRIKEAFAEGRQGANAFGPGVGVLPTPAGQKFDRRVGQMKSTLSALTRVPGIGAMSDYETRLEQEKFPKRGDFEDTTADQIQGIEDQLALIERGYTDLLSGAQPQPVQQESPQPAPQAAQSSPTATGPGGQKLILQNGAWVPLGN